MKVKKFYKLSDPNYQTEYTEKPRDINSSEAISHEKRQRFSELYDAYKVKVQVLKLQVRRLLSNDSGTSSGA